MTITEENEENSKLIKNVAELIEGLGEDPNRAGLQKTPKRFVRSLNFLLSGYQTDTRKIIEQALFNESYEDMVVVKDIEFYSLCEHHLIPFFGKCHIGYIPRGKVVGLSKLPRIVNAFARRLQLQERLTHQISQCLQEELNPLGVGVVIEAQHLCVMMRGVQKQQTSTITSSMQGCFRNLETREEFMSHLK